MERVACSALVNGYCTNGFVAYPVCRHTALIGGVYSVPECLNEEHCGRKYAESGGRPPDHVVERVRKLAARETGETK